MTWPSFLSPGILDGPRLNLPIRARIDGLAGSKEAICALKGTINWCVKKSGGYLSSSILAGPLSFRPFLTTFSHWAPRPVSRKRSSIPASRQPAEVSWQANSLLISSSERVSSDRQDVDLSI